MEKDLLIILVAKIKTLVHQNAEEIVMFYINPKMKRFTLEELRKRELAREREWRLRHIEETKNARRTSRYNLSQQDFDQLYKNQDGMCAICGTPIEGKQVCVDHDHILGNVRGLLCRNCNGMLGHAKDSVFILKAGIEYLNSTPWEEF